MKSLTLWVVGFKDAATSSVGGAVVEEATGFSSSSCKSELFVLASSSCSWVLGVVAVAGAAAVVVEGPPPAFSVGAFFLDREYLLPIHPAPFPISSPLTNSLLP